MGTEERERAAAEVKWYFNVQEERRVQNQQRFRRRRDGSQLLSNLLASEWRNEHELRLYERKKRRERGGGGERERENGASVSERRRRRWGRESFKRERSTLRLGERQTSRGASFPLRGARRRALRV